MLVFDVKSTDALMVGEKLRSAKVKVRMEWGVILQREMQNGIRHLVGRYRNGPTSPTSTKRISSNLAGSYSSAASLLTDGVLGEMGLMRYHQQGNALSYGWVHELGYSGSVPAAQCVSKLGKPYTRRAHNVYIPARPPEGAVNATRKYIQPVVVEKLTEATVGVLGG